MYMRRQTPAADSALATGSRGHDEAWPSEGTFLDSRLRGNDRMRRCSRMLPGFGVSPKSLFYTPKIEDPPQEEWGPGGWNRVHAGGSFSGFPPARE